MALIVSAASGNFNAGATWVGGVVPTVGDEARASTGHTITISANATCNEISNAGTGTFILSNGITLTANATAKTTTSGVVFLTYSGNTSAAIVGNITGNTNAAQSGTNRCLQHTGSGTLNITGNCSSSGASNSNAVANTSSGTVNIVGNVTAGGSSSQFAGPAVTNTSTGNISITGNVTASESANTSTGVTNTSTGTVTVIGTITAAQNNAGIQSTSTGPLILTGPFIMANNGRLAVWASFWRWASTIVSSTYFQIPTSDLLSTRNLVTDDNVTGMPAVTNVRSGTVYGPTSSLTGTCAIPAASSVASGVPVDNTTGTALLTGADVATAVWGAATRSITGGTVDTLTNAPASVTPSDIWSHASRTITGGTVDTLTNAPSVPSAASIRAEIDSNSTQLAAIKAKTNALPASPAATGDIPTESEIAAEVWAKPTTELTITGSIGERAKNQSTVSTTGAQLAAALS